MKLHLPKTLLAAVVAVMALDCAPAVDSSNIGWDAASGVWKWNGTGWVRGTKQSGSAVTDWETGYTWAANTSNFERTNDKGPILLVDGSKGVSQGAHSKDTSDGGGLVAINGATGSVAMGRWGGYVYVDESSDITATLNLNGTQGRQLKNLSANASNYSVVACGTLTFGNDLAFDDDGTAHKWFVGKNGRVTINGNLNRNGKGLTVDVEEAEGKAVDNRTTKVRTVLSATRATSNNDLNNATVRVLNDAGQEVQSNGTVKKTGTEISIITGYTQATLVWNGGATANDTTGIWRNAGTGWYVQGDTNQTDTGFIHGDNVIFASGTSDNTVTLGGDIIFDTMTVQGNTSVDLGRNVLSGNSVNVTGGTLTLSNPKAAGDNDGNMWVGSWETSEGASITYSGSDYRVYNSDVTFNATMTFNDALSIVGNSTVNVTGGKLTVGRIRLHDYNGASYNEKMIISGGVVNVTKTDDGVPSTFAGILLGHWRNDNNDRYLALQGGVLNATNAYTLVGWDSKAQLLISAGEANLYLLGINYNNGISAENHTQNGSVTLSGSGRLNIGSKGIIATSSGTLNVSGGTIGTLADAWTLDQHVTLSTSGAFTIDTEKRTASNIGASTASGEGGNNTIAGASTASGEGGNITIAGALTGNGNLTKIGKGTLTLNHANSGYSGNITVSGGALKLANAGALGTGTLTVETGGTLIAGIENALAAGTFTVETGGTLIVGENIRTSLNTDSIEGTLTLETGSRLNLTRPAGADRPSLSIGTLGLNGDATIGMSFDQNLLTSFSVGTSFVGNSHTLTLDFSEPLVPLANDTEQVVASGLSGATLNLTIAGQTVTKETGSDTWSKMIGRTTYTWTLADTGDLTFSKAGSRVMNLEWNGGTSGTWAQGAQGGESWLPEGSTEAVVFENGDSVAFARGESTLTVSGTIVVGTMSLQDDANVTLDVAADDTSSSLTTGTLTLSSATLNMNGLTATVNGDLTVGADKTATINLTNSNLTVTGKLSTAATTAGATTGLTLTGDIRVGSIEAGAGSTMTIDGAVSGGTANGAALAITAGDNATVSITGNVTSASGLTLTAGTNAGTDPAMMISGNVTSASGLTLTAGTGSSITLSGNVSAGAGGVTINGNVTIGSVTTNDQNESTLTTFTHGGNLTIASGTTTLKAYRNHSGDNITVAQGATLDASAGTLWKDSGYVGSGDMIINGTYIAKNLAYDEGGTHTTTTGAFHNNANHFQLGNGAEVIVTNGTDNDAQGMKLMGTANGNTYTITFREGATSTMIFGGGLQVHEASYRQNLVFNVEQNASVTLAYQLGTGMSSNWDRLTTLTKSGAGTMQITKPLSNFAGTIDVQAGTMKLGKAAGETGELVLPNLKLSGGTTQITNNTTLTKMIGCEKTGEGETATYASLTVDTNTTLKTGAFEKAEYVLNGLGGTGTLEYTGTDKLTLGMDRELGTVKGSFKASSATLEFSNLYSHSSSMAIEGTVDAAEDVEVVSLANLTVKSTGVLKSGGSLKLGRTADSDTNTGTLTAEGRVEAAGGATFRGTSSTLKVKSDQVTIGNDEEATHFHTEGENALGNVIIDGGKTLTVKNSLIDRIRFAQSEGIDGNGAVKIEAGSLLKGAVGTVDADASDSHPDASLTALMSECTLRQTDVIVTASGAIDAKALDTEGFMSKTFALSIMSGVTIEAGTTFSLSLLDMGNYNDVMLHWSVQPSGGATNSVALFSAGGDAINLDDPSLPTQVDFTGAPVVFTTTNGAVVDVWATYNAPEPTTGTLSVLALAALAARRRRRE